MPWSSVVTGPKLGFAISQSANVMGIEPAISTCDPVYRPWMSNVTICVTPCSVSSPVAVAGDVGVRVRHRSQVDRLAHRERGGGVGARLHDASVELVVPAGLVARHGGHVDREACVRHGGSVERHRAGDGAGPADRVGVLSEGHLLNAVPDDGIAGDGPGAVPGRER